MKNKVIQYGRQSISTEDINAVNKILNSDFLTQGPAVSEFENKISKFLTIVETKSNIWLTTIRNQ